VSLEAAIKSPIDEGVTIGRERLEALGRCEWLLTNGLGGFAMGTVSGIPERRYHAWLIAAMRPPLGRVVTLSSCAEWLVVENGPDQPGVKRYELSSYQFGGGTIHPHGVDLLRSFAASAQAVEWEWALPGVGLRVTRGLLLAHGANAAMVRYTVQGFERRAWLEVRPLVGLRDFHGLRREGARFDTRVSEGRVEVMGGGGEGRLMMTARREDGGSETRFVSDPQWWRSFEYERDRRRELDSREDLFSPGVFTFECGGEARVSLQAWVDGEGREAPLRGTWEEERGRLERRGEALCRAAGDGLGESAGVGTARGRAVAPLVRAADQFVVKRESAGKRLATIIAGYPWFSDWGRDTFISMRGLLLATGRHAEALEALLAFAGLQRRGLIPNCFDDGSGRAQYNTVDASPWFVHAACEYLRVTGDRAGFTAVRGACLNVIDAYRDGTDFGIRMDRDGLITAGNERTQLTWMDARHGDVVFTARHGKAVEINALWYSGLLELAGAIEADIPKRARELRQVAELAGRGFEALFWNPARGCLFDVVMPGGADGRLRPNQIFAVSQPYSALSAEKRAAVVGSVRERLLTPVGLRTLEASDPGYRARFEGGMFERDGAYHNGTVWPWLIGPYCEAVLRVGRFSEAAKREVRGVLAPLLAEFGEPRTPGGPVRQIPEVYDGEPVDGVRRADACMAQAWSVGEVIRVMALVSAPKEPAGA
jgi:predicted glycogen debranching enzyme